MIPDDIFGRDEPVFVIGVAARILGLRSQTLRYYERLGLVEPIRTTGNHRVYSRSDIERLRYIRTLINDLGVNLAGVDVVLRLMSRLQNAEDETERLRDQNRVLQQRLNST